MLPDRLFPGRYRQTRLHLAAALDAVRHRRLPPPEDCPPVWPPLDAPASPSTAHWIVRQDHACSRGGIRCDGLCGLLGRHVRPDICAAPCAADCFRRGKAMHLGCRGWCVGQSWRGPCIQADHPHGLANSVTTAIHRRDSLQSSGRPGHVGFAAIVHLVLQHLCIRPVMPVASPLVTTGQSGLTCATAITTNERR